MSMEKKINYFWKILYTFLNVGFMGDTMKSIKIVKNDHFKSFAVVLFVLVGFSMLFMGVRYKKTNLTFFIAFVIFNSYLKFTAFIVDNIKNRLKQSIFESKKELNMKFSIDNIITLIEKIMIRNGVFIIILIILSIILAILISKVINFFFFLLVLGYLVGLYKSELTNTKIGMVIFLFVCASAIYLWYNKVFSKIDNFFFAAVFALGGTLIVFFGSAYFFSDFLVKSGYKIDNLDDFSQISNYFKLCIILTALTSFLMQLAYIFARK